MCFFKFCFWICGLASIFFLLSCGGARQISGEIIHKKGVPHTYQGDFAFTSSSYAVVRLVQWTGADHSEVLAEKIIEDIKSFPIRFHIQLDETLDFSQFSYSVSADVFSQEGGKRVGDLTTEVVNELKPGQGFVTLEATGVEDCRSEGHGGFCLTP